MVTCRSIWFMIAFLFLLVFVNLVDFAKNFYEFTSMYLISFATIITNITFITAMKCTNMLLQSYCCCCCCFIFDHFHKPAINIFCLSLYFYQSNKNGIQHKRKNGITSQVKYFKLCAIFCLRNCIWLEYFSLLFHS